MNKQQFPDQKVQAGQFMLKQVTSSSNEKTRNQLETLHNEVSIKIRDDGDQDIKFEKKVSLRQILNNQADVRERYTYRDENLHLSQRTFSQSPSKSSIHQRMSLNSTQNSLADQQGSNQNLRCKEVYIRFPNKKHGRKVVMKVPGQGLRDRLRPSPLNR